jgi:hypothetical protein
MTRLIGGALAGTLTVLLVLTAGLSAFMPMTGCSPTVPRPAGATLTHEGLSEDTPDAEQVDNVRTILAVGDRLSVPPRGQIIAVATAIQESGLHNLPFGDADSL